MGNCLLVRAIHKIKVGLVVHKIAVQVITDHLLRHHRVHRVMVEAYRRAVGCLLVHLLAVELCKVDSMLEDLLELKAD